MGISMHARMRRGVVQMRKSAWLDNCCLFTNGSTRPRFLRAIVNSGGSRLIETLLSLSYCFGRHAKGFKRKTAICHYVASFFGLSKAVARTIVIYQRIDIFFYIFNIFVFANEHGKYLLISNREWNLARLAFFGLF